jgi:hypothetical protein
LALGYVGLARLEAWYLTRGEARASAYLRRDPRDPDFWPGLSDLDLVLTVADEAGPPGAAAARARERWRRLQSRLGAAAGLFDWPRIFEPAELRGFASASTFTYGLEAADASAGAAYFGPRASLDAVRALERPGLYGATDGWRRLSGSDRRPVAPDRDPQAQVVAAWLELVYWWRWAFRLCATPIQPRAADLSVKLIAETARIWLLLAHGERASSREDAMKRAMQRLPEEEDAFRFALELRRRLPDSPDEPLREALPPALRMSGRVAGSLESLAAGHRTMEVRLVRGPSEALPARGREPEALPLADWRALACAPSPDESFVPMAGDPGDPTLVGAAATSHAVGPYPALRADGLLVMPAVDFVRGRLRSIKCPTVDPVVFGVLDGSDVVSFPEIRGWSAADTARRAVVEHRARLDGTEAQGEGPVSLLGAARAGLFADSIERGEPELCLTPAAVAERLSQRTGIAADTTAATRQAVESLPPFRA